MRDMDIEQRTQSYISENTEVWINSGSKRGIFAGGTDVSDGGGEAVVRLLYVPLLPVALPQTDPGPGQSRVSLDRSGQQRLRLGGVVWENVQSSAPEVGKLLPRERVCGEEEGEGGERELWVDDVCGVPPWSLSRMESVSFIFSLTSLFFLPALSTPWLSK